MTQAAIPAVFMRGGTSKALVFHQSDLPAERARWDAIFLAALGSPDPYRRQLDGMGGGLSSLSKICIIAPPSRDDADIDYLFAQVFVDQARVAYDGNCGNMSSAMGPFAVDEGLVATSGSAATVRIHNINTGKIIRAEFPLADGRAAVDGDLAIPGVAGTGAPVRLVFEQPGGAASGRLLPTGRPVDRIDVPGIGMIAMSLVDAANPVCFVRAADLGLAGTEMPASLDDDGPLLAGVEQLRIAAYALIRPGADAGTIAAGSGPLVALVSPCADASLLTGGHIAARDSDLTVRMFNAGQPHRAAPLTGAVCCGIASAIEGTLPHQLRGVDWATDRIRLATPSGVLTVAARVAQRQDGPFAEEGAVLRTQRRLFQGTVLVPARLLD